MNKIKIVALFGKAGAGKDALLNEFLWQADHGGCRKEMHKIVNCTTRPKRENEKNGFSYNFIDPQQFYDLVESKEMIEATSFNDWFYGTTLSALDPNKINIGVFNPSAIECLLEDSRLEIYPIEIWAQPKERLLRQLNRENDPHVDEIVRRYLADEKDYADINIDMWDIIENDDYINEAVKDLADYINQIE